MIFPKPTQDERMNGWDVISPDFVKDVCDRFIFKHRNGKEKQSIEIIPCDVNDLIEVVEEALFWFNRK